MGESSAALCSRVQDGFCAKLSDPCLKAQEDSGEEEEEEEAAFTAS